ncbi:MAG: hypothetical protein V1684_01670 [bacterium]
MKTKKLLLLSMLLVPLLTMGAACGFKFGSTAKQGSGVFKSFNQGKDWVTKVAVPMVGGKTANISSVNVTRLTIDPQDNKALYLGTGENGLFYSYTGAESWFQVPRLNKGKISAVIVDPADKCNLYVATGNRIVKSVDCGRTWFDAYFETRVQQEITDLAIDGYNPQIIYAGTSAGDLLKSADAGKSWMTIERFKKAIRRVLVNYYDTRIIYVATKDAGIFKSTNAGGAWTDLEKGLKAFPGAQNIIELVLDKSQPDVLVLASQYGLLKTIDGGLSWSGLELLTPPKGAMIYSLALDPKNSNNIYYATATTFYKSADAGQTWVTRKLPTDKAASALLVDSVDGNIIYLGTYQLK